MLKYLIPPPSSSVAPETYVAPAIDVIEAVVEHGFAATNAQDAWTDDYLVKDEEW